MLKLLKTFLVIFATISLFTSAANAQFGKNKVQYQTFDWKYIESKHFDVYFDAGSSYIAKYSANSAERALASIEETLNWKIRKRISMMVYNSHNEFQQTNVIMSFMPEGVGGVTELYKNRVVVPFQGDFSQLDHVIHHELVHAVLNDMLHGGSLQTSISTGGQAFLPIWMNEGLAEFESIGGMNTETDMFMRDLTISEYLPPLEYLSGYLAYRGGQTFYWYVADKYGPEKIGELITKFKINKNVEAAFRSAFNMKLEEFSEQWQKDLKKYYWTDLDVFDDPKDFAVAVTDHKKAGNFYNSSPAVSPNGEKVAFIADEEGLFGVFVQDIDNKESRQELVSSFRAQDFEDLNLLTPGISWSPDGKKIAISAKAGPEDAVFIVDADDGDYDKLTFGLKSISSVVWSPDGDKIAFVGTQDCRSDIFIYNINNKEYSKLTDDVFSDSYPVWANDSKSVFFISDREDNLASDIKPKQVQIWNHNVYSSDIYRIYLSDKKITRLTFDPDYQKTSIAVGPKDNRMLFVSDKNGIGNIYELNLKTNRIIPKTNSINGISQLSLTPDASKLLFNVQVNAGYDIYMIRYPFEKNLDIDTLPLTKFRQKQIENKEIINSVVIEDFDEQDDLKGYGDFDIEFSRQEIIKPNPDLQAMGTDSKDGKEAGLYDDSTFVIKDYKVKFSPDLILANPGYSTYYGMQGVTQMLFSDIMGDHQIFAQANLLTDLRNSSIYVGYYYMPEIIDYNFNAYHSAGYVRGLVPGYEETGNTTFYRFRNWGLGVTGSLPFDMFNRIEASLAWMNVSKENALPVSISGNPIEIEDQTRMMFVPEFRYVHDDVLWGNFGPAKGSRYFVGIKGTPKLTDKGIGFTTFKADFRHYIHVGAFMDIAVRGAGAASFGPNPQNFFLGGTENWINPNYTITTLPFENPEDFAFMEFVYPLRGFELAEKVGSKYFVSNVEFRFPLFRALLAGPVPILFQGVQGALFLDVGGAFNDDFKATYVDENGKRHPQDLMMSSGIGVRTYLLGMPVKMDVAWRNEFSNWSKPEYLFSLGYDF